MWIDHFRESSPSLVTTLENAQVLMHPFVLGELACGNLNRDELLSLLGDLPAAPLATDPEVLHFIECRKLMGRGIGYIDAHLLASVALDGSARLWTGDKHLAAVTQELGMVFTEQA